MNTPSAHSSIVRAASAALFALVAAGAANAQTPKVADPRLESARSALEQSDYAAAEQGLRAISQGPSRGAALVDLARVELATGRYAEADKTAEKAAQADRGVRGDALAARAEAQRRMGKTAEAISLLESVKADPGARAARLLLGELLIATGRRADAREPLMTLVADYNQNAIAPGDVDGLALVGRAAELLRSPRDANDAYNQAERAGKHRVKTLLLRADLFLDKYDPGHAEDVVKEALQIAPRNAAAHVAMARVKLDQALDFAAAEREVKEALATDPNIKGAFFVQAGLALRTMDLAAADAVLDRGLSVNPGDLELESMKATVRFLSDDKAGFERAKRAVFAKNPEYSRFFQIVGEFADWEHRYDEIVAMMREAVKIDPDDAKAWADLGINLIRAANETEGVTALRRAWDKDHFNVRVLNTLNLFEKHIATSYETIDKPPFRIRYSKEETAILSRYVPVMLDEAWGSMVKRYGFTPKTPVSIELYATKENFAVRTSGLPHVGIQGVCFGRTLAAMSPRAEPFNWGNVLWHELAHVFAIQLSKSRVPRWFTEGLSEYETIVRRPEWQREEDPSLYVALRAGRLPPLDQMNRAFTHADDARDVMTAYYAASQYQIYLADTFGMAKIVEMLRLFGEGKRTDEVIKQALGLSTAELDGRLRRWLADRLKRYDTQFVPDEHAPELAIAKKRAEEEPGSARRKVELALALAGEHKLPEAEAAIAGALLINPLEPDALFLRAKILRAKHDEDGARRELVDMVRMGIDGYAVRMMLADLALAAKRSPAARSELLIAHEYDPTMVEALQALYDLDHKEGRETDALGWLQKLAPLDQHDRKTHKLLLEGLVAGRRFAEARKEGELAIFVDVESPAVHALYARALGETGDHARALFELESGLVLNPKPPEAAALHASLAKEHLALGQHAKAKAEQAEALRLDPSNEDAKSLKIP